MATTTNNNDPFTEATKQFTQGQNQFMKMWTDFAGKMSAAGTSFSPESTPPDAARQMRSAFFDAWTDYCKEYMRSPEFLDSMKKGMDGAIEFRRQMNQSLGQMHHDLGGSSRQDVDQLMMALSHIEKRFVDNLERVGDRLGAMEKKISSLEKKKSKTKAKKAKPKKPAKKAKKKKKN